MFKFWKKKPSGEAPTDDVPADESTVEAGEIDSALLTANAAGPMDETATLVAEAQVSAAELDADARQASATGEAEHRAAVDALSEPTPTSDDASTRRSWRERLGGSSFSRGLGSLFARNPKLDDDLLDELETLLITADVGVAASTELVEHLRTRVADRDFADADALLAALRSDLLALLQPVEQPLQIVGAKPFVIKTTTIGKLARIQKAAGKSVVLAAGDTFRAAAVQQLTAWGERNSIPVIAQGSGADSASVIYDALQTAGSRGADLLIADTAGRLHTQIGLMDELSKIRRVLSRFDAAAPHEVLLVIDGTTGQNAVNQTRQFRQAIGVTGLVVTKLDGTAKGGVVFALALRTRTRVILIVLLALLTIIAFAIYHYIQPQRLSALLVDQLQSRYGLQLSMPNAARIGFSPDLSIKLDHPIITASSISQPLLSADSVDVALPWSTLFGSDPVIDRIALQRPRIDIDALQAWLANQASDGGPTVVPSFDLNLQEGIVLRGGQTLAAGVNANLQGAAELGAWIDDWKSTGPVSPIPPLSGTLDAKRISIGDTTLEGVRLRIDDDAAKPSQQP